MHIIYNLASQSVELILKPDSKVHGANMGLTWVLSAPDGPHVGPMNLAIRAMNCQFWIFCRKLTMLQKYTWLIQLLCTLCNLCRTNCVWDQWFSCAELRERLCNFSHAEYRPAPFTQWTRHIKWSWSPKAKTTNQKSKSWIFTFLIPQVSSCLLYIYIVFNVFWTRVPSLHVIFFVLHDELGWVFLLAWTHFWTDNWVQITWYMHQ